MADQQLEDNKLPVREWLRKHYIESENRNFAICRHCSSQIPYRKNFINLHYHLCHIHSDNTEALTEEQKRDRNVHWVWDYFIPKSHKEAECHICSAILHSNYIITLTKHLNTHRLE